MQFIGIQIPENNEVLCNAACVRERYKQVKKCMITSGHELLT